MDKKENIEKQIHTLKEIRDMLNVNRTEFSRYMGIPLRTLEEWEAGRRKMPDYVLRLIAYYVKTQKWLKENGIEMEGEREVERQIEYYNLDVIISVGYRVKSKRGVEFRRWANSVLKNYILKGYLRRVYESDSKYEIW